MDRPATPTKPVIQHRFISDDEDAIVHWLRENYRPCPDYKKFKVPVGELYHRYQHEYCAPTAQEPKRKCEFGKHVRRAFPGVRIRRLGPANKQVSFYCGITNYLNGVTSNVNSPSLSTTSPAESRACSPMVVTPPSRSPSPLPQQQQQQSQNNKSPLLLPKVPVGSPHAYFRPMPPVLPPLSSLPSASSPQTTTTTHPTQQQPLSPAATAPVKIQKDSMMISDDNNNNKLYEGEDDKAVEELLFQAEEIWAARKNFYPEWDPHMPFLEQLQQPLHLPPQQQQPQHVPQHAPQYSGYHTPHQPVFYNGHYIYPSQTQHRPLHYAPPPPMGYGKQFAPGSVPSYLACAPSLLRTTPTTTITTVDEENCTYNTNNYFHKGSFSGKGNGPITGTTTTTRRRSITLRRYSLEDEAEAFNTCTIS